MSKHYIVMMHLLVVIKLLSYVIGPYTIMYVPCPKCIAYIRCMFV